MFYLYEFNKVIGPRHPAAHGVLRFYKKSIYFSISISIDRRYFHSINVKSRQYYLLGSTTAIPVSDTKLYHFFKFLQLLTHQQLCILAKVWNISIRNLKKSELIAGILEAIDTKFLDSVPLFLAWLDHRHFFTKYIPAKTDGAYKRPAYVQNILEDCCSSYTLPNLLLRGWDAKKALKLCVDLNVYPVRNQGEFIDTINLSPNGLRTDLAKIRKAKEFTIFKNFSDFPLLNAIFVSQLEQCINALLITWAIEALKIPIVYIEESNIR